MEYNFDEMIDRRNDKRSYSLKWTKSPVLAAERGMNVINDETIALFIADMDFKCAPPILEALRGVVDHGIFGYSCLYAVPDYYDAVINWMERRHNWKIKPEELIYVDGTVEALKQIVLAFTEPGDGVIIQRPVYTPFSNVINQTGRVIVNNHLLDDGSGYYEMDFDDLAEKARDPRNKLLLLCNPHNPVGRIWTETELICLADICRENNVIIASDEVHGDLIRVGAKFPVLATLVDNSNIITATAVNKTFNLAGLHCTNLIIPNVELRNRFTKSFGVVLPSPFTIAAVIAAYNECENWLDELRVYLDGTIDWVLDFLHERMPKVKCCRPEGTYVMWLDFREYGLTPEQLHSKIYHSANVILESGFDFDPERGGGLERICIPSSRKVIQTAIERIAEEFKGL